MKKFQGKIKMLEFLSYFHWKYWGIVNYCRDLEAERKTEICQLPAMEQGYIIRLPVSATVGEFKEGSLVAMNAAGEIVLPK